MKVKTKEAFILETMSWPELRAIVEEIDMVLIPVGSTEQHGPNLSLRTDIALARAMCERLAAQHEKRLLVAPSVPWGVSEHHMTFPGTITLSARTLATLLQEVVASLAQHGLRRFLFVNGHGGNIPALDIAVWEIERAVQPVFIGACTYYAMVDPAVAEKFPEVDGGGHACGMETSLALALCPELVKRDTLAAKEPGPLHDVIWKLGPLVQKQALNLPVRFADITTNGCLGDATQASLACGKAMADSIFVRMSTLLDDLIAVYPDSASD